MRLTPENPLAAWGGTITAWLAILVLAGVVALTWFGYRAANEWQSNAAQLIERRQQQVAVAMTLNIVRDMRAVQQTVIDRREWAPDELDSPEHLARVLAPVFRRYAYPEVFFASQISAGAELPGPRVAPPVVGGSWRHVGGHSVVQEPRGRGALTVPRAGRRRQWPPVLDLSAGSRRH